MLTKEELFSRAFPNSLHPDSPQHQEGISKLGWYAATIMSGDSLHITAEIAVQKAEELIEALAKRHAQFPPEPEEQVEGEEDGVL